MPRISIIGSCGSGKSTLARKLSARLEIPYFELDAIAWQPNWQMRPAEELRSEIRERLPEDAWIVDGNYRQFRDLYLARATHVVWLNYSFPITFRRLFNRTIRRIVRREILWDTNRETFRMAFCSRDSILWYMTKHYNCRRRDYRQLFADEQYADLNRIELRHPRDADLLLAEPHAALCLPASA